MAKEIERRFLVHQDKLPNLAGGKKIIQGYFTPPNFSPSVRVRLYNNSKAYLTLKFFESDLLRDEFEYPLNLKDAKDLLSKASGKVEKTRFQLKLDKNVWIIDKFEEENFPLILAEIELNSETQIFSKPLWIKGEVTNEKRYSSASLAFRPFGIWD